MADIFRDYDDEPVAVMVWWRVFVARCMLRWLACDLDRIFQGVRAHFAIMGLRDG